MAIYQARTTLIAKNGIKLPYEIDFDMNCHGKIKNVSLISACVNGIRPYMFLDLLSKVMPTWLYYEDVYVSFAHTQVNHCTIGKIHQPCLKVEDPKYGERKYLINRNSDEQWLKTIYHFNLCAMVQWWRENREYYFKKPIQEWEITRLN